MSTVDMMIDEEEIFNCPLTKLQLEVAELTKKVKLLEQDNYFKETSLIYQKDKLNNAQDEIKQLKFECSKKDKIIIAYKRQIDVRDSKIESCEFLIDNLKKK